MHQRICCTSNTASKKLYAVLSFLLISMLGLILGACGGERKIEHQNSQSTNNTAAPNQIVKRVAGTTVAINANFDTQKFANADFARGGQLYDNWFATAQLATPTTANPIWSAAVRAKVAAADTWRCSTCHGWDYKGVNGAFGNPNNLFYSGIHGILPAAHQLTDAAVWSFLRDGTVLPATGAAISHRFIGLLNENDLYDLTKFVSIVRTEAVTTAPTATTGTKQIAQQIRAQAKSGATLFNANAGPGTCVSCHGPRGNTIASVNVQTVAVTDPARTTHRVRFGIASSNPPMPGTLATTNGNIAASLVQASDITIFAGHGGPSDHIRGGRMYDDWVLESGTDPTTVPDNPLWRFSSVPAADRPTGIESWHCADCHGWDYEGGIGFENNNLVDLKEVRGWGPNISGNFQFVFDKITQGFPMWDPTTNTVIMVHNYGQFLTAAGPGMVEQDVWDLVDFVIEETVDTHQFLQPDTGAAVGRLDVVADSAVGAAFFNGPGPVLGADSYTCAACHTATGNGVLNGVAVDLPGESWVDPWRIFHRTRFGMPRAPGDVLPSPFDPTATFMPGILEATKADGITPTDNDDAMHTLRYMQIELNGGIASAGVAARR